MSSVEFSRANERAPEVEMLNLPPVERSWNSAMSNVTSVEPPEGIFVKDVSSSIDVSMERRIPSKGIGFLSVRCQFVSAVK